jgi:hypothetical protein
MLEVKISAETRKAISVILIYTALLFFLIGIAARAKMEFHGRVEISTAGFVVAAILATGGLVNFLSLLKRKQRE